MRYDVVTIGSASRDVFIHSSAFLTVDDRRFPTGVGQCVSLGSKIDVNDIWFETGGGATNAAVTFARNGFRTGIISKVGHDIRATEILRTLARDRVATDAVVQSAGASTAYSVILTNRKGGRTILSHRGASRELRPSEIRWSRVPARWVYATTLAGNRALLRRLLRHVRDTRAHIAMNPGTAELRLPKRFLWPLLRSLDILLLNREEAALVTGIPYAQQTRIEQALAVLPGIVVITDGSDGAVALAQGRRFESTTHRSIKRVEVTGAGDAFGSGFVAWLMRHPGDIPGAMQFGTANAESVMQIVGAKNGIIRRMPPRGKRVRVRITPFPSRRS